jgi:hypothetical protein
VKSTNAILLSGGIDDLQKTLMIASEDMLAAEKFLAEINPDNTEGRLDWSVTDARNVVHDASKNVFRAQTTLANVVSLLKLMKVLDP